MFNTNSLKIKSYRRQYAVDFCNLNKKLLNSYDSNTRIIIDSYIYEKYPLFKECFELSHTYIIEPNEKNKELKTCEKVVSFLIDGNFKRNHKLLAIGGGITQDIAAFTASIIYRGIEWEFMPTTLLAQADSCIGSKSSINFLGTKNALGTFYPPSHIKCCSEFLNTLSTDGIKSGIGEVLHYYLIENSKLIPDLISSYDNILLNPVKHLPKHIAESLRIKKNIIQQDEFDENKRKVFNYGHTFGHAIESISNYQVPHGLAVTIGMNLANYISLKKGFIDKNQYDQLHLAVKINLIDYRVPVDLQEQYYSLLMKDKKNIGNCIVCVLPYGIGNIQVSKITDHQELKTIIQEYMSGNLCL